MRIGIDAHIILPQHKRYDLKIARFTEALIQQLVEHDKQQEHTWVLFFDERMKDGKLLKKFQQKNVEIKHFPFVQYRRYLPVFYSHMLISAFLRAAHLDVFHSPEGLIPFLYPGKIITSFHYVPRGDTESNLFARTFMLGARAAFAQLCKRARRITVNRRSDKTLLVEKHGYAADQVVVYEDEDLERIDWPKRAKQFMKLYQEVVEEKRTDTTKRAVKKATSAAKK